MYRTSTSQAAPPEAFFDAPPEFADMMQALEDLAIAERGWWWRVLSAAALGAPRDRIVERELQRSAADWGHDRSQNMLASVIHRLCNNDGESSLRYRTVVSAACASNKLDVKSVAKVVAEIFAGRCTDPADRLPAGIVADAIADLLGNMDVWCDALIDEYEQGSPDLCVEMIAGLIAEFNPVDAGADIDAWVIELAALALNAELPSVFAANICSPASSAAAVIGWLPVYALVGAYAVDVATELFVACGDGGAAMAATLAISPFFAPLFN